MQLAMIFSVGFHRRYLCSLREIMSCIYTLFFLNSQPHLMQQQSRRHNQTECSGDVHQDFLCWRIFE